ncbi:MAG TPA: ABC transporter substrate-binding protein [Dissulfurispiraceae bacterium]|nr:ABC transporter substrate-binding protein [Dissulfurispiraceae bacterium]
MSCIFLGFFCVLALSLSSPVAMDVYAGDATEQVRATVDKVIELTKDQNLKKPGKARERRLAIRMALIELFDFEEMAKRSLSVHWQQRTAQERREFVSLFTDLLDRSYMKKIEGYDEEKIVYIDEKIDGSYAVVRTKIVTNRNVEIPIDYRMLVKSSKWKVYDVSIEGVSLVNNYRSQFNRIIRTSSYPELVRRMKNKLDEELFREKNK